MATILLDTSIASLFHTKKSRTRLYELYRPHLQGHVFAVSFQTVAELLHWPQRNGWGKGPRAELDHLIDRLLVIPYDLELARRWASVRVASELAGRRLEAGDAWIAATAIQFGLRLFTHDNDLARQSLSELDVFTLTA